MLNNILKKFCVITVIFFMVVTWAPITFAEESNNGEILSENNIETEKQEENSESFQNENDAKTPDGNIESNDDSVYSNGEVIGEDASDNLETESNDIDIEIGEEETDIFYQNETEGNIYYSANLLSDPSFLSLNDANNITLDNVKPIQVSDNTITVYGAPGLILLSNVNPNEYKDKTIEYASTANLSTDTTETLTIENNTYNYLGLGDDSNPFSGKFKYAIRSENYSIVLNRPLFNSISDTADVYDGVNQLKVEIKNNNTNLPVFANKIIDGNSVQDGSIIISISLKDNNSNTSNITIGGIVQTLSSNSCASVTINLNITGNLTVTAAGDSGLFCSAMEDSSKLIAVIDNPNSKTIEVNSNANAGGYVGNMVNNNTLTIGGKPVNSVKANSGNAGGIAGTAKNATYNTKENDVVTLPTIINASFGKSAGGLAGEYVNTEENVSLDFSKFRVYFDSQTNSDNVGGLYGLFKNSGNYTIGNYLSESVMNISSTVNSRVANYGGLIGKYKAFVINNDTETFGNLLSSLNLYSLNLYSLNISSVSNVGTYYGGVIASLDTDSYIKSDNLTINMQSSNVNSNIAGGFAAYVSASAFLNIGSFSVSGNLKGKVNRAIGGLVGILDNGVVRLHGTTDISRFSLAEGGGTGQIIGRNEYGFIYSVGDGNGKYKSEATGWKLIRNSANTCSDIGNWGQIIRLDGIKLSEKVAGIDSDSATIIDFSESQHKITILGSPAQNCSINSVKDFASYVFSYINNSYINNGTSNNAIVLPDGSSEVKPNTPQSISINGVINLTGTGITSIGRDDAPNPDTSAFTGTITGVNNGEIVLDIGNTVFGYFGNAQVSKTSDNDTKGKGGILAFGDAHNFIALLPTARDVTFTSLKISGDMVVHCGDQSNKNHRFGGLVSYAPQQTQTGLAFNHVEISASLLITSKNALVYAGGFVADTTDNTCNATFNNCVWSGNITNDNYNSVIGGYIGRFQDGGKTINVNDCEIKGSVTLSSTDQNAKVGGLVAVTNESGTSKNTFTIDGLSVNGCKINTSSQNTSGGLFGYSWNNTDAVLKNVTISNCQVNACGRFGGLVYQSTGYWNLTTDETSAGVHKGSIKFLSGNIFKGLSPESRPSGLLVAEGIIGDNALYMEVGEWGTDKAYEIVSESITITDTSGNQLSYFDELVGNTMKSESKNAIVSLCTGDVPVNANSSNNTYSGQLSNNYKNSKSRYYYNLNKYRRVSYDSNNISSPQSLLCWSVSQYAATNLRGYFFNNSSKAVTISGTIDLTGYSYYPVTPLSSVNISGLTLTFAYDAMNESETTKQFNSQSYQHFCMHCGLFDNIRHDLVIEGTNVLSGTVGKTLVSGNIYNSGALVFGQIYGNGTSQVTMSNIKLSGITLSGLSVSGIDNGVEYAPLLINKIDKGVNLTVSGVSTGEGYSDFTNKTTKYAATNLIGNVGSADATYLSLIFSNISLDSRKSQSTTTSVWNNKTYSVEYYTYHSIFIKSTLLNSFMYATDSYGTYNFESDDTLVTYGSEIANIDSGRNQQEQLFYYDFNGFGKRGYIWDSNNDIPTNDAEIAEHFNSDVYLPYVSKEENSSNHEIDINIISQPLLYGCGTYGHPYEINDGKQFVALANYLNNDAGNFWIVCVDNTLLNGTDYANCYHHEDPVSISNLENVSNEIENTLEPETYSNYTPSHVYYIFDKGVWHNATKNNNIYTIGEAVNNAQAFKQRMDAYLRNAYYQVMEDINIKNNSYSGIGNNSTDKAFSGVISGWPDSNTEKYPTVYISSQNAAISQFGGLVRYSQGSVIINLNVSYCGKEVNNVVTEYKPASLNIVNSGIVNYDNNPFFGGVIGYCMGGDTIIDNVKVELGDKISISGNDGYDRLIATGGYVGLVGGATTDSNGYEKTGGGVIFKNMNNGTYLDQGSLGLKFAGDSNYFYCNPFVGRVLDGYACYEGGSLNTRVLNNTDKNYTIPNLVYNSSVEDLKVESGYKITVNTAQGLWLLSSIVNSGAAAMDSGYSYTDSSGVVDAYHLGKPRSADYSKIGQSITDTSAINNYLKDELFWGGISKPDKDRVSYLISKYTNIVNNQYFASSICGKSVNSNDNNNGVSLVIGTAESTKKEIDMSSYGNGFRGIGANYGRVVALNEGGTIKQIHRRTLVFKNPSESISAINGNSYTLLLNIQQKAYIFENKTSGWFSKGIGLFNYFSYVAGCKVENITLSNKISTEIYSTEKSVNFENGIFNICVGGFAARTINSTGDLKFNNINLKNLTIIGGIQTGGLIGCLEKSGGNKNITIGIPKANNNTVSWMITDSNFSTKVNSNGGVGGLIGWNNSGNTLTIQNGEVRGLTINTDNAGGTGTVHVGGLVNGSDKGVIINDVSSASLNVSATNAKAIGGFVGKYKGGKIVVDNCILDDLTVKGIKSEYIGGIIGYSNDSGEISNSRITGNTRIYSDANKDETCNSHVASVIGGVIGYADSNYIAISSVEISGNSLESPIKLLISVPKDSTKNAIGGFIGCTEKNNNTVSIDKSTLKYAFILSGDVAGGFVGYHDQKGLNVSNSNIINSAITIPKQINNKLRGYDEVGLIVGYSTNYINGYNILSDASTVGYTNILQAIETESKPTWSADELLNNMTLADIASKVGLHNELNRGDGTNYKLYRESDSLEIASYRAGKWVGYVKEVDDANNYLTGKRTCVLVAVAEKDSNLPRYDIGEASNNASNTTLISYADYPVDQTNKISISSSPYLDVNPVLSSLRVKETLESDSKALTGNGVGYLTSISSGENEEGTQILNITRGESIAKAILNSAATSSSGRKYFNIPSGGDTGFAKLLNTSSYAYVTDYQTEENDSIVSSDVDFPMLVINNTSNADDYIWTYVAALTNVSSGELAKLQVNSVSATTYKWQEHNDAVADENGKKDGDFIAKTDGTSLTVDSNDNKTITITQNLYDNKQNQFTLLDIKYRNPTSKSDTYFHLYVPVLVKKVLYTKFTAQFITGTNYDSSIYSSGNYATAGFNDPITAYIEYNYDKKTSEWQTMVDEGANLIWNYQKSLDLAVNDDLPAGTKLTLVDKNTRDYFTCELSDGNLSNIHNFNLSTYFSGFEPLPVSELLDLSIVDDKTDGKYVETAVTDNPTIVYNGKFYRLYDAEIDTGENVTRFDITVNGADKENKNYLSRSEGYYLTMLIPSSTGKTSINSGLTFASNIMTNDSAGAPLAFINDGLINNKSAAYVVYDALSHTFVIESVNHIRGDNVDNECVMQDNDVIQIVLKSTISLNEENKNLFYTYQPSGIYHQFNVELKKFVDENISNSLIGAENVKYSYSVTGNENTIYSEADRSILGSEGLESIQLTCNEDASKAIIDYLKNNANDGHVEIKATVSLIYPVIGSFFPSKTAGDDSNDGVSVAVDSRVANYLAQLPIASLKESITNENRYYTQKESFAKLTYFTYGGDGYGNNIEQLGINPIDQHYVSENIKTGSYYDYSDIDQSLLSQAKKIKYSLSLYQKDDGGGYNKQVSVRRYFNTLNFENPKDSVQYNENKDENGNVLYDTATIITDFSESDTKIDFREIVFVPYTGKDDFEDEDNGRYYSNYRLVLKAVLLDANGNEIPGTSASDYIVYTNAKIYQQIIRPSIRPSTGN